MFGDIVSDKMILNEYGNIANKYRLNISNIHQNIEIKEFIIMPNHIHGIIKINTHIVGEDIILPYKQQWLSNIIKWFKQTTTKQLRKIWLEWFQRQRSFHDHIIKNEEEFEKIVEYIKLNPYKRENDEYYC